jgi:hypothetical protein
MAWVRGQQLPAGFRQDITYEQIIKEQVKTCLDCYNSRDRDGMESALTALSALMTPKMRDAEFIEDVEALDAEWKKTVARREKIRRQQLRASDEGCPDLVPAVSQRPNLDHLARQFAVLLSLLERRKLALKPEVEDSV